MGLSHGEDLYSLARMGKRVDIPDDGQVLQARGGRRPQGEWLPSHHPLRPKYAVIRL